MTMKDYFSQHRPPTIRHFFPLAVVMTGDCAMTLAFHVLQKICPIKISLQSISTFGRNIAIPLKCLGPVTVFQYKYSNLWEASRTSSPGGGQTEMSSSPAGPRLNIRKDVLSSDLVKFRSYEIGTLKCHIALKLDRHIGSNAAKEPGKFQSDRTVLNTNLAASRLHEILR